MPRSPGRPKGSVNKTTAVIKDAIAAVYERLQDKNGDEKGHGHLLEWAEGNPTEFYKLASKLIPIQVGGDPDNPLTIVERRILDHRS